MSDSTLRRIDQAFKNIGVTLSANFDIYDLITAAIEKLAARPSILTLSAAGQTRAAASTNYIGLGSGGFSPTESTKKTPLPACALRGLRVYIGPTAQPGDGALTFTVRKNGVDTALTVVIPAGSVAGVYSDLVNSVTFADRDLFSLSGTNASPGTISSEVNGITLVVQST